MKNAKVNTLKSKMIIMVFSAVIPFVLFTLYLAFSIRNYSNSYDAIVSNMTIANSYNLNFREEMDDELYKVVVNYVSFESVDGQEAMQEIYDEIHKLRTDFGTLANVTTDERSMQWLSSLSRNIDTLEKRVDDIRNNLETGGHYDDNIEMLQNNIYILTELIQEDIQHYIYYQTESMDNLKAALDRQIDRFFLLCIILIILIGALASITVMYISQGIVNPIETLVDVTGQISEGDFSVRAGIDTGDEISDLAISINDMTQKLESMVNTIKEDERKMRHTELRLLQEQINPHFLYNTLDTIVWLIESNRAEEAEDMVVSLSSFFRLVLSHGQELITISDEAKHIRSYLEIQQVRYKDILDYNIEIDESIYQYRILKLTLQPLVENALYHGIKYKRAKGTIDVKGIFENGKIVLTVQDDGVGMDEETLNHLQSEIIKPCQETEAGFGLANVNERIRMHFGQEYGIKISSRLSEGTKVTVTIPARNEEM